MSDTLDYIDQYFNGELPESEKAGFEQRCVSDPLFAEEVAFYLSARAVIKEKLHEQKKRQFGQWYAELSARPAQPLENLDDLPDLDFGEESEDRAHATPVRELPPRKGVVRRLVPLLSAAAAACLILMLGWQFFFRAPAPEKLANVYIEEHMQVLGVTMGSGADSLQQGISDYNQKEYAKAEKTFGALAAHPLYGAEAVKNLGILYLVTGRYDAAVAQFDKLTAYRDLRVNEGYFYKAVALMKRGRPGDRQAAKELLEKVSREDLFGSEEARQWLKNL